MSRNLIGTTLLVLAGSMMAAPAQAEGQGDERSPRQQAAKEARAERAQRMAEALDLSDAQRKQVATIMAESRQRAAEIQQEVMRKRREARQQLMTLRDETRSRMDEVLNDEQRKKLEEMQQAAMERRKALLEQRGEQSGSGRQEKGPRR